MKTENFTIKLQALFSVLFVCSAGVEVLGGPYSLSTQTIDVTSRYPNWAQLTNDNFKIQIISASASIGSGEGANSASISTSVSYNNSTGVLTAGVTRRGSKPSIGCQFYIYYDENNVLA